MTEPLVHDKLWYLSQINVLEALPKPSLEEIERLAPMHTAPKGKLILSPENRPDILYLLKRGRVRLYKVGPNGKQFTLGILGGGNIFGEIEAFSAVTRDVYAEAMDDTLICALRRSDLEQILAAQPQLALKMLQALGERLREAEDFLQMLATSDVRSRLLYLLSKLAEQFGVVRGNMVHLDLDLTHQELANMIGSTRETVTATLSALSREGVVRTGRRSIEINREAAARFWKE